MNANLKPPDERGQALVVFVLALVAIVGMTGLVLDGGAVFAQRREQQNVADLAAMAAVISYVNTSGDQYAKDAAAQTAALDVAAKNGYPGGVNNTDITITRTLGTNSARYRVRVDRPHANNFAGLVGQPSWDVSASAEAITGIPNGVDGVMPLIFNVDAFYANWESKSKAPGEEFSEPPPGSGDIPQDATTFNWTVYCTGGGSDTCNADSQTVEDIINQFGDPNTIYVGETINPLNAGSHTTLYEGSGSCAGCGMAQWIGYEFPVGIVDDDGNLVGFATFHLTGVDGASRKVLIGYFNQTITFDGMRVFGDGGTSPFTGWVVYLSQ